MDKAILVGNGINNIESTYTWSDLIKNLIEHIGASSIISVDGKPFPLLYEEIYVEAVRREFSELQIKTFISDEVMQLKPNIIHKKIIESGVKNIITTNYDFTLEKTISDISRLKNDGLVKETTYNIFRHYNISEYKFWHIHGDSSSPNSITLGYEHYSGYLQQMRNYVVTGTRSSYKEKLNSLIRRLRSSDAINYTHSWLDYFFTRDIYIIGLTLDFVEIHLWWLLTYRQRTILKNEVPIKNKIYYFFPKEDSERIKIKLDLLNSVGVIPFSVSKGSSWKKYYNDVLEKVQTF